jgi:hypothetical protein
MDSGLPLTRVRRGLGRGVSDADPSQWPIRVGGRSESVADPSRWPSAQRHRRRRAAATPAPPRRRAHGPRSRPRRAWRAAADSDGSLTRTDRRLEPATTDSDRPPTRTGHRLGPTTDSDRPPTRTGHHRLGPATDSDEAGGVGALRGAGAGLVGPPPRWGGRSGWPGAVTARPGPGNGTPAGRARTPSSFRAGPARATVPARRAPRSGGPSESRGTRLCHGALERLNRRRLNRLNRTVEPSVERSRRHGGTVT